MALKYFASGYLVKDKKVLLVHHNKFDKWVPPGGHIEEGETPDQTAKREFQEEVGFEVEIVPSYPSAFSGDDNATPIPLPFHMDIEREGFDVPHIGYFYYVKAVADDNISFQTEELFNAGWFSEKDLETLSTFEQVRAVAKFAIENFPL